MDRSLSLFSVDSKLLIRVSFESSVHEFVRTHFEFENCKENMNQLEDLLNQEGFMSIHFRYEGKEHLRANAWAFIVGLIRKLRAFKKRSLKFGVFIRQDEKNLNEWNHHVRTNVLEVLRESQRDDWDFLIDFKHSNSNFVGPMHLEALYAAMMEVESEFGRMNKFFLVISANLFLQTDFTLKIGKIVQRLDENLKSLGLMLFDAGAESFGYDVLLKSISRFSELSEVMLVFPNCFPNTLFNLRQCLTDPKKKPIRHLRLYTVWNEMTDEGATSFFNLLCDCSERLESFGWALWDENPSYDYKELFQVLFNELGRKTPNLFSLKLAIESSQLERHFFWNTLLSNLRPRLGFLIRFGLFFDNDIEGALEPLLLLSKMQNLLEWTAAHKKSQNKEYGNPNTNIVRKMVTSRNQHFNTAFVLSRRTGLKSVFKRKQILFELLEALYTI